MGTKIQGNAFLRDYHSVIDLDGSTGRGTRLKNGESPADSFAFYDREKVRRTILEHESIFRHQLQELHRLYGRQRELMNEIRSREMNKDGMKEEKGQLFLFSPKLLEDARTPRARSMAGCLPIPSTRFSKLPVFENRNHQGSYDTDNRFSLNGVHQISQHKADALTFDFKRKDNAGDISANSCSNFNLTTKDFFPCSADRMYGGILGLRNERRGNEQRDDYAEKMRFNKLSSGKPLAFPQPKKEFSNCSLDIGASVSRKRKKIFGVEISEDNDDPINANTLDQRDENRRVLSSSWIDNSFMQSLHLGGANPNERSKIDMKCGLVSSKERFPSHSDMQGKWLEGCSWVDKVGYQHNTSDPNSYVKNVDNTNAPIQVRKKDSQQYEGGLPWFLRNSQVGDDQSKEKKQKSWYFMNLDSLQNSSQKFFGKAERPDDTFQTSNQNMNEANDGSSGKKIPISDVLQGSSIGGVSDLRHCIDLNLSLDEEDAPSAPYLPAAIVKMATTEIDLEASIDVIESPKEDDESKNHELECDKIAAEAMMAISALSPESASTDSLKWFAEIVCGESSTIPDGMDYFEYMTLKLEDTNKEDYHCKPLVLNSFCDDETGGTQTKRSRRRGRQRKDFQRDILPGLVTLSRLQVTEDFQAFDELLKAGGLLHRSSSRNGKGRRRPGAAMVQQSSSSSPTVKTGCSTEAQQPICQLEERSLAGWGKRTRRLPRQRCPNAFLSFPVKC
ncbi:hypothetical protein ACS0TY_029058 [Phlomoides rotata]